MNNADLLNGLYRVVTPTIVAGFVVLDGQVIMCAPILRKRLHYWLSKAERISA